MSKSRDIADSADVINNLDNVTSDIQSQLDGKPGYYSPEVVYTLTGVDLDPANGSLQIKAISENTTFTESLSSGHAIVLMLTGGASYTIEYPTITWVTSTGNLAPTLTAADTLVFWKTGSTLYGAYVGSYE